MGLNELRDEFYENARAHGFHDVRRSVGDGLMLITTEASEAFEAFREGASPAEVWYEEKIAAHRKNGEPIVGIDGKQVTVAVKSLEFYPKNDAGEDDLEHPRKPCGVPSEIADIIIRCLDFSGEHGIDIERAVREKAAYNKTRPFKHGNKGL
jgi:NTP pyrophosphatase (non-canonical NTP hydrolase)